MTASGRLRRTVNAVAAVAVSALLLAALQALAGAWLARALLPLLPWPRQRANE